MKAVLATGNAAQGGGDRARSSGRGVELVGRRHGRRRDRHHVRGERAAQGPGGWRRRRASWRWPTTPASRSTPSAARPASTRPAGPRSTTGSRGCCASSTACRRRERTARFVSAAAAVWPDGRDGGAAGRGRGPHRRRRPGRGRVRLRPDLRAGRGRRAHVRRDDGGREARAVAPGPGLPGAGRDELGAHQPLRSIGHVSRTWSSRTRWARSWSAIVGSTWAGMTRTRSPTFGDRRARGRARR